jgi:tetratricopeptide (TPR) repeat protein
MLRYLLLPLRPLRAAVRRRPRSVLGLTLALLVLVLLLLVGTFAGLYGYALHQWQAAQAAVKEDRAEEARSRLDLCLWLWPHDSRVHFLAARAARLSGHFDEADAHLKQCLKLDRGPSQATELEYLLMRAQTGEAEEVADALRNYVDSKHAETALILETLSRAYMHDLRYGLAYACLSRWIDELPGTAKAFHWRAWVLERLSDPDGAMRDYQRALELDPDLVAVRLRVAELLLERSRPGEALPHLERLRREAPERADVLARLGHCRFLQGRAEEARQLMEAAVQKLPDDSTLLQNLASLDRQEGRADQAERRLRHALEVDPTDVGAEYNLVLCLQHQGRDKEAAAALEHCTKHRALVDRANQLLKDEARHPTRDPGPPAEVGALLLGIGQERLGMYWLDQALIRDPGHQASHRILAEYFEKKGEPQKAARHRRWLAKAAASR